MEYKETSRSPRRKNSFESRSFGGGWKDSAPESSLSNSRSSSWGISDHDDKPSWPTLEDAAPAEKSPPDLSKALKVKGLLEILPDYGIIRQKLENLPKNWS